MLYSRGLAPFVKKEKEKYYHQLTTPVSFREELDEDGFYQYSLKFEYEFDKDC